MKLQHIATLLLIGIAIGVSHADVSAQEWQWHTEPNKWKEPREFQTPFEKKYESYISISHKPIQETLVADKVFSPNKAYWLTYQRQYTPQKPILIFNEKNYFIQIAPSKNDPDYTVKRLNWINEKLIYIEIWWGSALGSCFIYDVEKEAMLFKEMINDGNMPFLQWQQIKKTN